MNNTKAFTLIEVLVVVLIIGILAAIAVPQYQVSVEKSRASALLFRLKALAQAQINYYMRNNKYASTIDVLDIDMPGKVYSSSRSSTYYLTPDNLHIAVLTSPYIAGGTDLVQIDLSFNDNPQAYGYSVAGEIYCYGKKDSELAIKVCRSLGVKDFSDSSCGMIDMGVAVPCSGGKMN